MEELQSIEGDVTEASALMSFVDDRWTLHQLAAQYVRTCRIATSCKACRK